MINLLNEIREAEIVTKKRSVKRGGDINYINIATAFDIETTSITTENGKFAFPYFFAFAVNDEIKHMRTMDEFIALMDDLSYELELGNNKRLAVYVHNLPFEFKFISEYFNWSDSDIPFANGERNKVIRAVTDTGIEFRCSLALTGMKLEKLEDETGIPKMVGDLDYSLIRHANTKMTDKEIGYIDNDVITLTTLIRKRMKKDTIASIPMTSTGYIRRRMRNWSLADKDHRDMMKKMHTTPLELLTLRQTFMGGYTHANPEFAFETVKDVIALDIGSSYPAQIVSQQFPISKPHYIEELPVEDYLDLCDNHHVIAKVTLVNLENKGRPFSIISRSKAHDLEFPTFDESDTNGMLNVDNGRIHSAKRLSIYVTEIDLYYYQQFYNFEIEKVEGVFVYESGYLPREFLRQVIKNYQDKTELKDVEGKEDQYNASKAGNNGVYGMMVMDPIRPKFELVDNNLVEVPLSDNEFDDVVKELNKDRTRFLSYSWGVYVTAYARAQLFEMILKLDDAGVKIYYTDTDSVYVDNNPIVMDIMKEENKYVEEDMREVIKYLDAKRSEIKDLGITFDSLQPKNPKGDRYLLGAWEIDGVYKEFKTLGAKRYAVVTQDGKFEITCSGINKDKGSEYVKELGGMDAFKTGLVIPADKSGRNIARYSRPGEEFTEDVTDYLGETLRVNQKGWVHIEPTESSLTVADEFERFVEMYKSI